MVCSMYWSISNIYVLKQKNGTTIYSIYYRIKVKKKNLGTYMTILHGFSSFLKNNFSAVLYSTFPMLFCYTGRAPIIILHNSLIVDYDMKEEIVNCFPEWILVFLKPKKEHI